MNQSVNHQYPSELQPDITTNQANSTLVIHCFYEGTRSVAWVFENDRRAGMMVPSPNGSMHQVGHVELISVQTESLEVGYDGWNLIATPLPTMSPEDFHPVHIFVIFPQLSGFQFHVDMLTPGDEVVVEISITDSYVDSRHMDVDNGFSVVDNGHMDVDVVNLYIGNGTGNLQHELADTDSETLPRPTRPLIRYLSSTTLLVPMKPSSVCTWKEFTWSSLSFLWNLDPVQPVIGPLLRGVILLWYKRE